MKAESRRYAPFTQEDLQALFHSQEYLEGRHRSCWQFWVPLVALYTGARQAEIAQLNISDVLQEDGINIISITDSGDEQRVKTDVPALTGPGLELVYAAFGWFCNPSIGTSVSGAGGR